DFCDSKETHDDLRRVHVRGEKMALTRSGLLTYFHADLGVDVSGIEDATPLFSSSLLDSFSMVGLIMFIEQQAGIRMDVLDITMENLDSIASILKLVECKLLAD